MLAPILLSACLNKAGISAKGIDFSAEFYKIFSKKSYWADLKNHLTLGYTGNEIKLPRRAIIDILKFNKQFLSKIKMHKPIWLGLSIFTSESINYSYLLIYSIRKYLPNVKIIIGGKGAETVCSLRNKSNSQVYIENGLAELAVIGDCEHVIASAIKENASGIYTSLSQTKEDLDEVPVPNWDEYDLTGYTELTTGVEVEPYIAITSSKGCVRKCTFCDVASFWPKYIYRKPENVANEIITAYRKTGIDRFLFTDNLINGSASNYRMINQMLADTIPNKIKYSGYAIFRAKDTMPAEDFVLAKKAGCDMWGIGVESGSERVRFDLGKKITDEDLHWSVNQLAKNEITQVWLMMVGYPTETDEDFQETLELFKQYAHLGRKGLIKPSITPTFALLNNSPIMQNEKLRNDMGLSHNVGDEWSGKFWTSTVNTNNTFPVRAERWRTASALLNQLGYPYNPYVSEVKFREEVTSLEKLYNEKKHKIIPISKI